MTKINVDIDYIKNNLSMIGYEINDCVKRDNNGVNWQLKFSNSDAVVTIYDTNKKGNTVVNGKLEEGEKEALSYIVDALKRKEMEVDHLTPVIQELINSKTERTFYDFKLKMYDKFDDMLHDILCLSNNTDNKEAYLIIGVSDSAEVIGIDEDIRLDMILDFLKTIQFAGNHMPEIDVKNLYCKHKRIGVIICKSSKYVPFYLTEKHKGVFDNQIYTRVGNTNTPKNKHASYNDIEKLWRIHFQREDE